MTMIKELTRLQEEAARMKNQQRAAAARAARLEKETRRLEEKARMERRRRAAALLEEMSSPPDMYAGIDARLARRMRADGVTPAELQQLCSNRGFFPEGMPVKDYPQFFVEGWCLPNWERISRLVAVDRVPAELIRLWPQLDEEGKAQLLAYARQKGGGKEHGQP